MDAQKSKGQESKSPKTGVERNRRRDAERKAEGQTADGSSKVITMVQSKNLGKCGRKEVRGKMRRSEVRKKGRREGRSRLVLEEVHTRAGVNHQTTTKRLSSIGIH